MIKRYNQFVLENNNSKTLIYYAFDWDDNILNMPTKIHMEHLVDGEWVPTKVSTAEFAEVRNDKANWKIDYSVAFVEFRDESERGDKAFLEDVKSAVSEGNFGPAWDDFVECLSNGCLFAIITARGHESPSMRMGIEWVIDNVLTEEQVYEMYNNLLKFNYLFKYDGSWDRILRGTPSENPLIKNYLDHCQFIGVSSPSRGGTPDNPEKAKEDALVEFKTKVNNYAKSLGVDAKIGFSDDDLKNVKHIEDLFDNIDHEKFSNIIEFVVKGTKNPDEITKKVVRKPVLETSNQATGMESSVLKFTQFGNMTDHLFNSDLATRQDDTTNAIRKATKYLAKSSKEILKNKKR